jgi:hypothetical protein
MTIKTFTSNQNQIAQVIADVQAQGAAVPARAVVLFSSVKYPQEQLYQAFADLYPGAAVFGCSTSGELVSGKMAKGSVVGMVLGGDILEDVSVQVIDNLQERAAVAQAFDAFSAHFQKPVSSLDIDQYAGVVLCDGMSGAEERLMEWIGDLTDLTFIGGSSGDDLQFKQTYLYANGAVHSQSAVLVLFKTKHGFEILKTQSFQALPQKLVATEVDEAKRLVVEFNGKPAREAYAQAVGASPSQAGDLFMRHPLGLMVGEEPYVRSPQRFDGDKMVFFCNIKPGMEYQILEAQDIVEDTRKDLAAHGWETTGKIAGILNFHCILRTLELEQKGQTGAYADLFKNVPTAGFSTYGEAYIGHINQTSTMLAFKAA